MDKTIEVVVVAMVVLVTAVTIVFMVRGQADGFLTFADDQQDTSECSLYKARGQEPPERLECSSFSPDQYRFSNSYRPANV